MFGKVMTEKEYRTHPAVSRSELWYINDSPEKFKYHKENPEPPSPVFVLGQLFHKLALLPDKVEEDFACAPDCDRRTKEGKEIYRNFLASVGDKVVVDKETITTASEMVCAMNDTKFVKKLLAGERETSFFWTDDITGEPCKVRVDCLTEINGKPIIIDLKTARDASTEGFMRSAIDHGYDFQSAMYSEAIKQNLGKNPMFVFVVIEKKPPYSVNILEADEYFVKRGYDKFRELIGIYHECKESGNWYGYMGKYGNINELSLPAWLLKEVE